ncbi:hypothetical protein M378DRAFT_19225 [Amanita muscaria Koide BX008]|uniref:Uncharacterized protein n=1 Tax=Amanita muscaria (strain Koide BX008) TaxID=946122 RepID=A0A0C2SJJ1_AMAMK|nr:hypothetical protein M378DRAFT_19225 [Amanita muscaria Koide BX008]
MRYNETSVTQAGPSAQEPLSNGNGLGMDLDPDEPARNHDPEPERSPTPVLRPSGRPNRRIRLPKRYVNEPPPLPPQVEPNREPAETAEPIDQNNSGDDDRCWRYTERDAFGMYRGYRCHFPSYNPDNRLSLDCQCDSPNFSVATDNSEKRPWWAVFGKSLNEVKETLFAPFLNASTFHLMHWFYSGSNLKSFIELDRLVLQPMYTQSNTRLNKGVQVGEPQSVKRFLVSKALLPPV